MEEKTFKKGVIALAGTIIDGLNASDFFKWLKENKPNDFKRLFRQYTKYCLDETFKNLE